MKLNSFYSLTISYICVIHSDYSSLHPCLSPSYSSQLPPIPIRPCLTLISFCFMTHWVYLRLSTWMWMWNIHQSMVDLLLTKSNNSPSSESINSHFDNLVDRLRFVQAQCRLSSNSYILSIVSSRCYLLLRRGGVDVLLRTEHLTVIYSQYLEHGLCIQYPHLKRNLL